MKEKEFHEVMGTKRPPSNVVLEMIRETQKYRSAHSVAADTNQNLHEVNLLFLNKLELTSKLFSFHIKRQLIY